LDALEQERGLPLQLSVYAVAQTEQETVRLARWRDRFRDDPCVRFSEPVPPGEIPKVLSSFDYLAVPSILLESGPLVVYEAYAAGLPVIGSDLGGIAELVEHEKTGLLVAPGSVDTWRAALRRVVASPELHAELQAALPPARTMGSVAEEMRAVYERVRAA
jgi:glycosyltransferase involved in cell wall biosynthesis